ncbi:MAG: GTPase Era [Alphaproteobacteria bacterium]|nr:GTPase Era [Alphaproteobacteria bacterium]
MSTENDNAGGGPAPSGPTRCGFVALVGAPNAGKSTLLNRIAGGRLSIVSAKPQTTRFRVLAIVPRGPVQILLVDTPGIFAPRRRLDRAMVHAAWTGAADADITLLVVDAARGIGPELREIVERLKAAGRPAMLVLNKVDLVTPQKLLPLAGELNAMLPFAETFMVSAESGDGVERMLDAIAAALPEGPWLYPPEDMTDLPERMLAAEAVREQVFEQTHQEVPYGVSVETESWQDRPDGSARIEVIVYVEREGQRAILLGKGGARIKAIGAAARKVLEAELDRRVHLFLHVKHRPGWAEEGERLRALGLDDPK